MPGFPLSVEPTLLNQLLLAVLVLVILVLVFKVLQLSAQIDRRARERYDAWRAADYDAVRVEELDVARRQYEAQFQEWKQQATTQIRTEAVQRSRGVLVGKATEHLAPYFRDFSFNPSEARFLGSPIDFVVFDGLDEGRLRQVVFMEVKTGNSGLNARERQVRDAIHDRRVTWQEVRIRYGTSHAHDLLSVLPAELDEEEYEYLESES